MFVNFLNKVLFKIRKFIHSSCVVAISRLVYVFCMDIFSIAPIFIVCGSQMCVVASYVLSMKLYGRLFVWAVV
jgi:hypothetical protein